MPHVVTGDTYLGDGVYASFDGHQIWLDLRGQDSTTRIALDPLTFNELLKFNERIQQARKDAQPPPPNSPSSH